MPWHTFNINICRALKMATNATKVQQSASLSRSPLSPSPLSVENCTRISYRFWPGQKIHSSFFHFVASVIGFACDFSNSLPALLSVFVLLCEYLCVYVYVLCTLVTLNKLPQHLLAFHAKTLSLKFLWNLSWCVCFLVFPFAMQVFLHSFLHTVSRAFSNQMKI